MPAMAPLYVALTVDIDPDANRAIPGRADAVSAGHNEPVFTACIAGLGGLMQLLKEFVLPATLFWEGRTLEALAARDLCLLESILEGSTLEHACHGYQHEDFSGRVSGVPLGLKATTTVLQRARQLLARVLGAVPAGFRAPYCRLTGELVAALAAAGYRYDASRSRRAAGDWALRPYPLNGTEVMELALCLEEDAQGKTISGYLWQLFEGNRPVGDYLDLALALRERFPGGLFQVALHPWHLHVSADNEPLSERGLDPLSDLRRLLTELLEAERFVFTTLGQYLAAYE